MAAPTRVLVIHLAGLGDLVVSLPALAALRRSWPDARIVFVGDADPRQVVDMAGLGLELAPAADLPWRALWDRSVQEAPAELGQWDLALELWTAGGRLERYAALTGARALGLPPDPGTYVLGTMARRAWWWACQTFGLEGAYEDTKLCPGVDRRDDLDRFLRGRGVNPPFVLLHPGAGAQYKCWPEGCFWDVARRLRSRAGVQVVVVLGPRESGRGMVAPPDAQDYTMHEPEIADFAAAVGLADLYIGNDSGASHVAVWTYPPGRGRTPCVITFARLNVRNWATAAPWVTILPFSCAVPEALTAEAVYNEAVRRLGETR